MPSYPAGNPWMNMQFVDTTPRYDDAARMIAGVASSFSANQIANRQLDIEQQRQASQDRRDANAEMYNYLNAIRQDRLQETKQAMEMLQLNSQLKMVNYQLEQAKKMDDRKWQALDARQQVFGMLPSYEEAVQRGDLLGAGRVLSAASVIPGASDDEATVRVIGEYRNNLSKFTIDGKPALTVLSGIESTLKADYGSAGWDSYREAVQRVSPGTSLDALAADLAGRLTSENPSKAAKALQIKEYLSAGQRVQTPEDAQEFKALQSQLRANFFAQKMALPPGQDDTELREQYDSTMEMAKQIYTHGNYSMFRSSDSLLTGPETISGLVSNVQNTVQGALTDLERIRSNASLRQAYLNNQGLTPETRAKLKDDPEALAAFDRMLANRDPKQADELMGTPWALQKITQGLNMVDDAAMNDFNSRLAYQSATLKGLLSKIAAEPSKVSGADMAAIANTTSSLNSLLTPFYGAPPLDANYFNRPTYNYLRRQAAKNDAMRSGFGSPMGAQSQGPVVVPLTSTTPSGSNPYVK